MIAKQVKALMDEGYAPWGIVIPNPEGAPKGSGVYQFRKGKLDAAVVLTKRGRFVRGTVERKRGKVETI